VNVWNWGIVLLIGLFVLTRGAYAVWGRRHYIAVDVDALVAVVDARDEIEEVTH
jgi:hypothetical protein